MSEPTARVELVTLLEEHRMVAYEDDKGGHLFRPASPEEIADVLIAAGWTKEQP